VSISPPRAPASSAGSVDAKRSPPGSSAVYSGLMPKRSRTSVVRPLSRSWATKANMPCRRSTQASPQAWKAFSTTSVSPLETKR
jgi:hypothetical protein